MPIFKVCWQKTFEEDYGYDHTVLVAEGHIIVSAPSLEVLEAEIKSFRGCSTS